MKYYGRLRDTILKYLYNRKSSDAFQVINIAKLQFDTIEIRVKYLARMHISLQVKVVKWRL